MFNSHNSQKVEYAYSTSDINFVSLCETHYKTQNINQLIQSLKDLLLVNPEIAVLFMTDDAPYVNKLIEKPKLKLELPYNKNTILYETTMNDKIDIYRKGRKFVELLNDLQIKSLTTAKYLACEKYNIGLNIYGINNYVIYFYNNKWYLSIDFKQEFPDYKLVINDRDFPIFMIDKIYKDQENKDQEDQLDNKEQDDKSNNKEQENKSNNTEHENKSNNKEQENKEQENKSNNKEQENKDAKNQDIKLELQESEIINSDNNELYVVRKEGNKYILVGNIAK
jgi:hypothetical protein